MSKARHPHDYAIVIGINDYADSEHCLTSPVRDAQRVSDWLVDNKGGGLDKDNCKVLSGDASTAVTRRLIEDHLIAARNFSRDCRARGVQPRRLYYYFSGHGLTKQADQVLMCHALWSEDRPNANINSEELEKHYLNSCTWFSEVVVWLDCCRNRSLITKPGSMDIGCVPRDDGALQKAMLAFATLDGSYAFEGLTDVDENSVFTEALLNGLRHADNGSGEVSWRSLKAYLEEYVPEIAREQRKAQKPQVDFLRLETNEDPVFGPATVEAITLRFDLDNGHVSIFDQMFTEIIREYDLAAGELQYALPIGRYLAVSSVGSRKAFSVDGVKTCIEVPLRD